MGYAQGKNPNSHVKGIFQKGHKINVGRIMSLESREKMRLAHIGMEYPTGWHHSKETKEKIAKAHRGIFTGEAYTTIHSWLRRNFKKDNCEFCGSDRFVEWALKKGCTHAHNRDNYLTLCSHHHKIYDYTPERRKRLSESLKKVPHTRIWVERIARANRGRKLSEEHKQKISYYNKQHP